jgi:general secretion pathway protein K
MTAWRAAMAGTVRTVRTLRQRHRQRRQRDRESGVALLITISTLAMLIALVSDFTYQTSIYGAQAANARDEVRAHYLARSSIALSRLLIRMQQRFIEPIMAQAQQMLSGAAGGGDLGVSLRITDYAGPIMGFFGGSSEEVASLGSMIGLDTTAAKGLGLKHGRIDAEISNEDGKIDINCGGGPSGSDRTQQSTVYRLISALTFSPRYNRLFSERNSEGQFTDRQELARAILDWADGDEQMFSLETGGGAGEDYRYDQRADPYLAHNNFYDTADEVGLVRGMDANFLEAFLPYLTVHASDKACRVNLASVKGDCTPLLVGLIRAASQPDPLKPPKDPTVLDDTRIYPLASILCERGTAVGFDSLDTIVRVLSNPSGSIARDDPRYQMMQSMHGITITKPELEKVAFVGPPRVYRVVATGESGKVKKKITAIIDTGRAPEFPITSNFQAEKASGVLQYWREE